MVALAENSPFRVSKSEPVAKVKVFFPVGEAVFVETHMFYSLSDLETALESYDLRGLNYKIILSWT